MIDEFRGLTAEEWNTMTNEQNHVCPRCEYPLVPVHAVEGSRRRIIALTCPEPYCDHMQMIPRTHSLESVEADEGARAAN